MNTFGEVSWNDDVFSGEKKNTNSKDLFLRLKEGSNEMRLITQPFQYLVHKYKKEGDPGFGQKVQCSAIHGSCPLCAVGDKAKPRWLLGVINRDGNKYQILDISFAVFGQIRGFAKNVKHWGDPTKYDIDIYVDKNGGAIGYYKVQPLSKDPLSAADQDIKDKQVDLDDLKRRVTPPTPDVVQKKIDKINGVTDGASAHAPATKGKTVKAAASVVNMTDDDELEKAFPDYDGQQA